MPWSQSYQKRSDWFVIIHCLMLFHVSANGSVAPNNHVTLPKLVHNSKRFSSLFIQGGIFLFSFPANLSEILCHSVWSEHFQINKSLIADVWLVLPNARMLANCSWLLSPCALPYNLQKVGMPTPAYIPWKLDMMIITVVYCTNPHPCDLIGTNKSCVRYGIHDAKQKVYEWSDS